MIIFRISSGDGQPTTPVATIFTGGMSGIFVCQDIHGYAFPSVNVNVLIVMVCPLAIVVLSRLKSPVPCPTLPCMMHVVPSKVVWELYWRK
jgi:hypothetical protein